AARPRKGRRQSPVTGPVIETASPVAADGFPAEAPARAELAMPTVPRSQDVQSPDIPPPDISPQDVSVRDADLLDFQHQEIQRFDIRPVDGESQRTSIPAPLHESLQPLSRGVRVELSDIDDISGLAHELSIEAQRLSSIAGTVMLQTGATPKERFELKHSSRRIERRFLALEERLVGLRMVSLAQTFARAARLVDRLGQELGKPISVELAGRNTQLDKMIVDRISGPMYHLLSNAVYHGIEPVDERRRAGKPDAGTIRIQARLEGTKAVITISDDGRGIDPTQVLERAIGIGAVRPNQELSREEILRFIFLPGFSTAEEVSRISGRGVGMDAVERALYDLGGEIRADSESGKGSRFELAVPTTLVMISAFIVHVAGWRYAINVGQIVELSYVNPGDVAGLDGKRGIRWRGNSIPLIELKYLLGLGGARVLATGSMSAGSLSRDRVSGAGPKTGTHRQTPSVTSSGALGNRDRVNRVPVFITRVAERPVAIAVERFEDQREIIVKSLGSMSHKFRGVTGAVDLEGGDVALVLDLPSLLLLRSARL
ncbi:MAG TPA: chemotaxis protein CheW, partial [Blastocatellia bacterium]|nr:chemotaxis protein CheW [Blastocatellia bacterium]